VRKDKRKKLSFLYFVQIVAKRGSTKNKVIFLS